MTSERLRLLSLLPLVFASACHSHVEGITLELAALARGVDELTDADGDVLEVERFELRLDTFELLFCEDPVAKVFRELFLPKVARADHPSPGVPTVFDGPVTIHLTTDAEQAIGIMRPPPGRYCGAMLILGAAGLEGTLGGTRLAHELDLSATLFLTFDEALELSAEHLAASLSLTVDARTAFSDVDLNEAPSAALEESLREEMATFVNVEISHAIHAH